MTDPKASPQRIGWMDICYREGVAPWDIGEPQQAIRQLATLGAYRISGDCGGIPTPMPFKV